MAINVLLERWGIVNWASCATLPSCAADSPRAADTAPPSRSGRVYCEIRKTALSILAAGPRTAVPTSAASATSTTLGSLISKGQSAGARNPTDVNGYCTSIEPPKARNARYSETSSRTGAANTSSWKRRWHSYKHGGLWRQTILCVKGGDDDISDKRDFSGPNEKCATMKHVLRIMLLPEDYNGVRDVDSLRIFLVTLLNCRKEGTGLQNCWLLLGRGAARQHGKQCNYSPHDETLSAISFPHFRTRTGNVGRKISSLYMSALV